MTVVMSATLRNIVRVLVHLSNTQSHAMSYNIQTRDNIVVMQDMVAYIPTVNGPATELSTVHQVLNQSLEIMELLENVCVFDRVL